MLFFENLHFFETKNSRPTFVVKGKVGSGLSPWANFTKHIRRAEQNKSQQTPAHALFYSSRERTKNELFVTTQRQKFIFSVQFLSFQNKKSTWNWPTYLIFEYGYSSVALMQKMTAWTHDGARVGSDFFRHTYNNSLLIFICEIQTE